MEIDFIVFIAVNGDVGDYYIDVTCVCFNAIAHSLATRALVSVEPFTYQSPRTLFMRISSIRHSPGPISAHFNHFLMWFELIGK